MILRYNSVILCPTSARRAWHVLSRGSEEGGTRRMTRRMKGHTMRGRVVIVFGVALRTFISLPLFAHHHRATLSTNKPGTLKGTVKSWLGSNPLCLLTFGVKGE